MTITDALENLRICTEELEKLNIRGSPCQPPALASEPPQGPLLRPRRERPRSRRAANERDEFAPLQWTDLHPLPLARVTA